MIVGLDDFNAYSGNYEDKPEAVKLKTLLLESAEEVVTGYLGYGIEEGKAMGHWHTDKRIDKMHFLSHSFESDEQLRNSAEEGNDDICDV